MIRYHFGEPVDGEVMGERERERSGGGQKGSCAEEKGTSEGLRLVTGQSG